MFRKALAVSIAVHALAYTAPGQAQTEISCGYSECTVKGPLDAAAVATLKAEKNWNAKLLRFSEEATDADLGTVVALKDELLGLRLSSCTKLTSLAALAKLTKLEDLELTFTKFKDLELLTGMTDLKRLFLWKNPIEVWAPLAKLNGLTELNLAETSFTDPSLLAGMTGLKTLVLEKCPQFKDVAGLKPLPVLDSLRLRGTAVDVANAELFKGFPKLTYVALGKELVTEDQVAKLKESAPAVRFNAY